MIAVSTSWNFVRHGTLAGAVREIRKLGFEAVELRAKGAAPDGEAAGALCRDLRIRCRTVHAPLAGMPWADGDPTRDLASLSEARRGRAVDAALATLPAAAAAGAEGIVVHLGEVEVAEAARSQERWMTALASGEPVPAAEVEAARAERRARRDRHLLAAARSLFDLSRAEPGVAWLLENRYGWHEIPDLEETELLLSDAGGRNVGLCHDTGHAHVLSRLGFGDARAWLDRFGARTVSLHLHDVAGDVDHLPPGTGEIDWVSLRAQIGAAMIRVLEIDSRHSLADLRMGADHVR